MKFSVKTSENGAFVASLPANTYVAYVNDNGKRRYFTSDVVITDQDVTLNSFQLDITRYAVSGVVKKDETNVVKNGRVVFIAPDGEIIYTSTDSTGAFNVKLPGAAAGITYVVKYASGDYYYYDDDDDDDYSYSYNYDAANYKTLTAYSGGQVTSVTVTDGQQSVTGLELRYDFAQTVASVTNVVAVGTPSDIVVDRVNDTFAKVEIADSGSYQFEFATGSSYENMRYSKIEVYDASGELQNSSTNSYSSSVSCYVNSLTKGTYYVRVLPLRYSGNEKIQQPGTYKLSVTAGYTSTPVVTTATPNTNVSGSSVDD
jgi:hypothetical protein